MASPVITCLDMEGVIAPEIWLAVAEYFKVKDLQLTTRDIPDYDELMTKRLHVLKEHGIKLQDIQKIIGGLSPLEGSGGVFGLVKGAMPSHHLIRYIL